LFNNQIYGYDDLKFCIKCNFTFTLEFNGYEVKHFTFYFQFDLYITNF
jgi:hypothetical protein